MGLHIDRNTVFVGDSRKLDGSLPLQNARPFRFFSIDGGHDLEAVRFDADLASRTIAEFGVICFYDFCNPEWPDVTLGLFDFLRSRAGAIMPFAITQKSFSFAERNTMIFIQN